MLDRFIIEPIIKHADAFSKAAFGVFAPFCFNIFASFILLWFLLILYNAIFLSRLDLEEIFKKIVIFSIVGAALSAHKNFYWEYVHQPIQLTSEALVSQVISITPPSTRAPIQNNQSMMGVLENAISEMTTLIYNVADKAGIMSLSASLNASIIWLLFVAAEAIFALYLLGSVLKLVALSAFSPFLILASAFEKTRGHAISGIKYVLTSVLLLIIASFCMGLVLFALREVVLNIDPDGISKIEVFSILGMMFVLALAAIYFLLIAPEMASVIMGAPNSSMLPSMASGLMAAGAGFVGSKVGGILSKAALWTTVKAAKLGSQYVRNVGSNFAQSARNKFYKNYASSSTSTTNPQGD